MTGEAKVKGEIGQVGFLLDETFQRSAQAQAIPVLVDRESRLLPKNSREMKGRSVNCAGDFPHPQTLREMGGQQGLRPLGLLAVCTSRRLSTTPGPNAAVQVRASHNCCEKVQGDFIN
jgi:hypothetical protein